ncbi:hypothetical protein EPN95_00770 [Patescibacteria group bacterium]|nr:MAG: hypothetical protein EPN95_00770 [Patescibacteria group bacterium]
MKKAYNGRLVRFIRRKANAFISKRLEVRVLTGFAAIAIAILMFTEFLVKIAMGSRPSLGDGAALSDFITNNATQTLAIIIIDTLLMSCLIIFFAGFRQLIIRSKRELSWITDLAFGAGLVFVAVTLVGDAMDAGAALDTVGNYAADPSVLRALTEGHMLLFGSIGCILTALVTATFAYTTFASNAVSKWTGWVGYGVAVLNLLAVPTVFGGTSATSFFSAGGAAVTLLATFPFLAWVIVVGIVTIRKQT